MLLSLPLSPTLGVVVVIDDDDVVVLSFPPPVSEPPEADREEFPDREPDREWCEGWSGSFESEGIPREEATDSHSSRSMSLPESRVCEARLELEEAVNWVVAVPSLLESAESPELSSAAM